jgi:hypothetical protein
MRTHSQICIYVCVCAAAFSAGAQAQLSAGWTNQPGVKMRSGFSGTLSLKGREGEALVPVTVYRFSIWNRPAVANVKPLSTGLVLVQFQSGEAETVVGGTTNRSGPGDFLLLQRDSSAVFRAASETATFEALVLGGALAETKLPTSHTALSHPRVEKYQQVSGRPLKMQTLASRRVGDFSLEVQDLLVGPSQKTSTFVLPGASVLEIKSGKGVMRVDGHAQAIQGGTIITVKEGQQLELRNDKEDLGLSMHVTIIRSQ